MLKNQNGFTYVELILVFIALMLLIVPLFVALGNNRDKAREEEVKANVHIIQTAIERYYTDYNYYPIILLGGDKIGWDHWHEVNDEDDPEPDMPSNNLVHDPIIGLGYLESYPKNPFVDDGMRIIQSTRATGSGPNGQLQHGDGDPRFGFYGNTMSNGLDDPAYFKHRKDAGIPPIETPLIETRRTLDEETIRELGFCEPPEGLHYMMGGRKSFDANGNVITVATWWPGNFFYRSIHDLYSIPRRWIWWDPGFPNPRDRPISYILGAYGSLRTQGMDVIRLEKHSWDATDYVYYRLPPPWYRNVRSSGIRCGYSMNEYHIDKDRHVFGIGLPEVLGGGDSWTGPFYPYNQDEEHEVYNYGQTAIGAPDGHPDGIIALFTRKGEKVEF